MSGFAALRHVPRRARFAPIEVVLDVGDREREPGGQPSTTQPIAGPCDSPKEVTQNRVPSVLPDMEHHGSKARIAGRFRV